MSEQIRPSIQKLAVLDPLRAEQEIPDKQLALLGDVLSQLEPPLTDEEARALVLLLGTAEDAAYGMKMDARDPR
jgi:hypothetical protein